VNGKIKESEKRRRRFVLDTFILDLKKNRKTGMIKEEKVFFFKKIKKREDNHRETA